MDMLEIKAPIFFIRHGETNWNVEKRFQGQSDIPLNARGKEQAIENAQLLSGVLQQQNLNPDHVQFVTSPLLRAELTAQLMLDAMGVKEPQISKSDLLKEISFGLWEGLTSAEAKEQYYHQRQKRRSDRWSIAPPEGESFAGRLADVKKLLCSLSSPAVVVSHSGIMRIIFQVLQNMPPLEAVKVDIPHIGVHVWDGNCLILARNQ